jgi:hypothetical protein
LKLRATLTAEGEGMWMDDGALFTISLVALWALVAVVREALMKKQ